ncbi:MAG TPA: 4-alpha-glucanotransferase [Candidatus Baltobacteraceae bacterium]|nr:4-alpha-glucanotransferase [Candidatus Baltobacteraceae bacterium]
MIDELARAAGIQPAYTDAFGRERPVSRETKRAILAALGYDAAGERQAHRIARELRAQRAAPRDGFAGEPAFVPPELERRRTWGFALQLYSLRSAANWGIGDFGDLARFAAEAAGCGAGIVGLNPLHQLNLTEPSSASPYSPITRLFLNAQYIDVPSAYAVLNGGDWEADASLLRRARESSLVDYAAVWALKSAALVRLHERFRRADGHPMQAAFRAFCREHGAPLRSTAIYEALNAHFYARSAVHGWMQWPLEYAEPRGEAVRAFAREHESAVEYYEFLQWLADMQLSAAAAAARPMTIGLYRDLAVGVDANSADVWSDRAAYALGLSIGAPPDELNAAGQDWGLPPLHPHRLGERGFESYASVVRSNMRHAGALRIDHVMGLQRLFVIPHGAPPSEGAYLEYPRETLLTVLAAESRRAGCLIVGEDLGTVPRGFRERVARARIFSCRLLYFERDPGGAFVDPARYPADAVASTGTHDLPPLLGYWETLAPDERAAMQALLGTGPRDRDAALVAAAYRALARTQARIRLVQMEDALLCREPVNVPGTTTEHPNWRRKLPVALEALGDDAGFAAVVRAVSESRQRKEHA